MIHGRKFLSIITYFILLQVLVVIVFPQRQSQWQWQWQCRWCFNGFQLSSPSSVSSFSVPSTQRKLNRNLAPSQSHLMNSSLQVKQSSNTNFSDDGVVLITDVQQLKSRLSNFHPFLIEGPGYSDDRDATPIALRIIESLKQRIQEENIIKPILLVNQGDPMRKDGRNSGIASVFQIVVKELDLKKCIVCLDDDQPWHSQNADRGNAIYETRYSQMVEVIREKDVNLSQRIEEEIDDRIKERNNIRLAQGKKEIEDWVKDFVLLQEITKFAMKVLCGSVTVAHTISTAEMKPDSVTSFYEIGLKLNLINAEEDMIFYGIE